MRELIVYRERETSKTLELISILKNTSEESAKYALGIIRNLEKFHEPEFKKRLFSWHYHTSLAIRDEIEKIIPRTAMEWKGWQVRCLGKAPLVGELEEFNQRKDVLCTHPYSPEFACYLCKWVDLEKTKKYKLVFEVSPFNQEIKIDNVGGYTLYQTADWILDVMVDGKYLDYKVISWKNKECKWIRFEYDLSEFAGKKVGIILQNRAKEWYWEQAFWTEIKIEEIQ